MNDMLLRNMIYRLHADMIDSPKGEYDMFGFAKRCSYSTCCLSRRKNASRLEAFISI